jgi:hypothetical protein
MKYRVQILQFLLLPILIWSFFGCGSFLTRELGFFTLSSVSELKEAEQSSQGESVYVQGKVIQIIPLIESSAYQLQDYSGTLWVIKSGNPPQIGDYVTVKGTLKYQDIEVEEHELGEFYLEEAEIINTE